MLLRASLLLLGVAATAEAAVPPQVQADWALLTTGWNKTIKINDVSPLSVFGPSAFPIVASDPSTVAMAGMRMGAGRVIASGHQVCAPPCGKGSTRPALPPEALTVRQTAWSAGVG